MRIKFWKTFKRTKIWGGSSGKNEHFYRKATPNYLLETLPSTSSTTKQQQWQQQQQFLSRNDIFHKLEAKQVSKFDAHIYEIWSAWLCWHVFAFRTSKIWSARYLKNSLFLTPIVRRKEDLFHCTETKINVIVHTKFLHNSQYVRGTAQFQQMSHMGRGV